MNMKNNFCIKKNLVVCVMMAGSGLAFSQTHHVWEAESSFQFYGRVIDIAEVAPSVLALQTFTLDKNYQFENASVGLYNTKEKRASEGILLTSFDSYRGGFGQMKDNSLVLNTINTDRKYELLNVEYNEAEFKLSKKGTVEGVFAGIPGGITSLKGGGYVAASAFFHPETEMLCNQLFLKKSTSKFGLESDKNDGYTHNMLMKPYFMEGMHNSYTPIKNPKSPSICSQVIASNDGAILSMVISLEQSNSKPIKIVGYTNDLKEEWELEFAETGYGFKPIATGIGKSWFLTTFEADATGKSQTKIQKYDGKNKTSVSKILEKFEANGSLILANGDLCVYGFSSDSAPVFYVLNPTTLEVKKSWALSENDEPCTEISEAYGQTVRLPGKFYSATQLADGSVVFGGHLISDAAMYSNQHSGVHTFNYLLSMPASFFKN